MLKKIDIEGHGFTILKDYDSWRIAQIGYDSEINSFDKVSSLGQHHETDEVFVLIKGCAYMITAGIKEKPETMKSEKLEKGKLYVISENQWHVVILEADSNVLIFENRDTGAENSKNHTLSEDERKEIQNLVNESNK